MYIAEGRLSKGKVCVTKVIKVYIVEHRHRNYGAVQQFRTRSKHVGILVKALHQ